VVPDLTEKAGVERINFQGTGSTPGDFITLESTWNCWVLDLNFEYAGQDHHRGLVQATPAPPHLHARPGERREFEGLDLLTDVDWSLDRPQICVAGGFPDQHRRWRREPVLLAAGM
jgi:hypothetical protein